MSDHDAADIFANLKRVGINSPQELVQTRDGGDITKNYKVLRLGLNRTKRSND